MAIDTVLVTNVSGTAWLRQADGSLLPLREGMRVPVNAEIVTDNGSTVQLQGDGMPPLTVGENREFAVSPDLAQDDVDPTEQSVSVQADPDAARVLAALQAGEDPFEVLDPTAAVITGGGDDGGSSFTRLLSIVETTVPLALEYPRPTLPERDIQRLGGRGVNNDPESLVVDGTILAQINDDSEFIDGFDVSQYFFDADNDPLTFSATGLPPGLSIDPNTGIISGTIDRSASQGGNNGVYHVVVTATDPKGGQGNIEFTWTALNPPPVAELDTETTEENTLLEVSKENGLLSNDNDPDGDDLVVTQIENENGQRVSTGTPIQGSNGGTLIVNPDGSYSFNPGTDFDYLADGETADVTFTYTISDGEGGTDTAQLVITVTGSNDAPVLVPDVYDPADGTQVVESGVKDDGTGEPNTPFAGQDTATGNVLTNDSDVDSSDTLSVVRVAQGTATADVTGGSATLVGTYGTLVINDDGSYTYTLRNDDEDTQRLAPGARANEEFTYTVSDGHTEVSTTLTIVVHGTNDKPVIDETVGTDGEVIEAGHNDAGTPEVSGTLAASDVDAGHQDKLTWHLVDDAGNVLNAASQTIETDYGQLVLDSATGEWTYTLDNTKEATQKLAEGESYDEKFTVRVRDPEGAWAETTITVTVNGTNDAPVLVPDVYDPIDGTQVVESGVKDDGTGNPNAAFTGQDTATGNVLTNDSDVDGSDKLTVVRVAQGTATSDVTGGSATLVGTYGTLVINEDGSYTYTLRNDDEDTEKLAPGERANEEFTYTVSDGHTEVSTTLTIVVHGTNDRPEIDVTNSNAEGAVLEAGHNQAGENIATGTLKGTDVDAGHEGALTWHLVQGSLVHDGAAQFIQTDFGALMLSGDTGEWTYVLDNDKPATQKLAQDQTHKEAFTVRVRDPEGAWNETTITVTITGTNDAPVLVPDVYDPTDGTQVVESGVKDDGTGNPNAPFAGQGTATGNVLTNDSDVDGSDILTVVRVAQGTTTADVTGGSATLVGTYGTLVINDDGSYTYTLRNDDEDTQRLAPGARANEEFTYTVSDGHTEVSTTLTIVVHGTNDKPVIDETVGTDGEVIEAGHNDAGTPEVSGTLAASDVDAGHQDKLTWHLVDDADNVLNAASQTIETEYGQLVLNSATGQWTYTLDNTKEATQKLAEGESYDEKFTVRVRDPEGAWDQTTITVTVTGTNDIPVIEEADAKGYVKELPEDKPSDTHTQTGEVRFTDVDTGDTHSVTVQTPVGGEQFYGELKASITSDGVVTWTFEVKDADINHLAEGEKLTQNYVITIKDKAGLEVNQPVEITIEGTNDTPRITSSQDQHEGLVTEHTEAASDRHNNDNHTADGTISFSDVDVKDEHSVSMSEPSNGIGKLTYSFEANTKEIKWNFTVPDEELNSLSKGETLTQVYTFTVDDGHGGVAKQDVTITIIGTNDIPEITSESKLVGDVKEQGVGSENESPIVKGALYGTDVDSGAKLSWSIIDGVDKEPNVSAPEDDGRIRLQELEGEFGTLTLNPNGEWVYELDNEKAQSLAQGDKKTEEFVVRVYDEHGAYSQEVIKITVQGTNDNPIAVADDNSVIESGVKVGGITEELGKVITTGNVLSNDLDDDAGDSENFVVTTIQSGVSPDEVENVSSGSIGTVVNGAYGTLTIFSDGRYTYELWDGDSAVNSLFAGQKVQDSFTYEMRDEHGASSSTTLTINITGTNDKPEIDLGKSIVAKEVSEQGAANPNAKDSVEGVLVANDPDSDGDIQTWQIVVSEDVLDNKLSGKYGDLTLDAKTGRWTYTLDNTREATQKLGNDDRPTETFNVRVTDKHGAFDEHTLTITVQGSNDAPTVKDHLVTFDEDPNEGMDGNAKVGNVLGEATNPEGGDLTVVSFKIKGDDTEYAPGDTAIPVVVGGKEIGTLTLQPNGDYAFVPKEHYSGEVPLITYTVSEPNDSKETGLTAEGSLQFVITPVADAPTFGESKEKEVKEDTLRPLALTVPKVVDNVDHNENGEGDNPELLGVITISGLPEGASLVSVGGISILGGADIKIIIKDGPHTKDALESGAIELTEEQFEALQFSPNLHDHTNVTLEIAVSSYEVDGTGSPLQGVKEATTTISREIDVRAVTDEVSLEIDSEADEVGLHNSNYHFKGIEDKAFDLSAVLKASFEDLDGSEERWFEISGLEVGSTLKFGNTELEVTSVNQVLKVPANAIEQGGSQEPGMGSFPKFSITAPEHWSGQMENVKVTLVAQDHDGDSRVGGDGAFYVAPKEEASVTFHFDVSPVADGVSLGAAVGDEDTLINVLQNVQKIDTDGSESVTKFELTLSKADAEAGWSFVDEGGDPLVSNAGYTVTETDGATKIVFSGNDIDVHDGSIYLKPPLHSNTDIKLGVLVETRDLTLSGGAEYDVRTQDGQLDIKVRPVAETVDSGHVTINTDHSFISGLGQEDTWFKLRDDNFNLKNGWSNNDTGGEGEDAEKTYALLTPILVSKHHGSDSVDGSAFQYKVEEAYVSAEYREDLGGFLIPMEYLDSVEFLPPTDVAGEFAIKVQAYTVDKDKEGFFEDSTKLSGEAMLTGIVINPVADGVQSLALDPAHGREDQPINLFIRPTSKDPSETFIVRISEADLKGGSISYNGNLVDLVGGYVTIENFNSSAPLVFTPPTNASGKFPLKVEVQTVDKLGAVTNASSWTNGTLHVDVKGVADAPTLELKEVSFNEGDLDGHKGASTSIAVEDLIATATLNDTDSETLSFKITGLPDGFNVEGANFTGGKGEARVWTFTKDQLANVKISTSEHFSGKLPGTLTAISTERDGDSNATVSKNFKDSVTILPTPEAEQSLTKSATIDEDAAGKLSFVLNTAHGDTNEEVTAVYLSKDQLDGLADLQVFVDGQEIQANTALTTELIGSTTYYKIPSELLNKVTAQAGPNFAHNGGGSFKLDLKFDVIDKSSDGYGDQISSESAQFDGTYEITVTPVTDPMAAELAEGGAVEVDADSVNGQWTIGQTGKHTLGITLSKTAGAGTGTAELDDDGSERLTQFFLNGVPEGMLVKGIQVGGSVLGTAVLVGPNQWVISLPETAALDFNGPLSINVVFDATENLVSQTSSLTVTASSHDRGADNTTSATVEVSLTTELTGTGPGGEDIEINWKRNDDFIGKEDTPFVLSDLIDGSVSLPNGQGTAEYSVVLTLPEGSIVKLADGSSAGQVSQMSVTADGEEVWVITTTGGPADLDALLSQIEVKPPLDWNDNKRTDGSDFYVDATLNVVLPNGQQKSDELKMPNLPVTPETDPAKVTVDFYTADETGAKTSDSPTEGNNVGITVSVTNEVDGPISFGEQVYIRVPTDITGEFSYDGKQVNPEEVTGVDGLDDDSYIVLELTPEQQAGINNGSSLNLDLIFTPSEKFIGGTPIDLEVWVPTKEKHSSTEPDEGWKMSTAKGSDTVAIINNGYEIEVGVKDPNSDAYSVTGDEVSDDTPSGAIVLVEQGAGSLVDGSGREAVHSVRLDGLPNDFLAFYKDAENQLQATNAGNGVWTIPTIDGKVPEISVLPPKHWSGTLEGLQLTVLSGETSLKDTDQAESTATFNLVVTPVADGLESLTPFAAFGNEGDIVRLNLNAVMVDAIPANNSTVLDGSVETISLTLSGIGEHAAFYIGNKLIDGAESGPAFTYDSESEKYTITGLSQEDINNLGIWQAVDKTKTLNVAFEVWTVENANGAKSVSESGSFELTLYAKNATSGDDELFFDGSTLLDGGAGDDTVWLRFDEDIDFATDPASSLLRNIETIDLTREGFDHELTNLSVQDVLDMTDSRNVLTIKADDGDVINLSDEWELKTNETESWYEATGSDSRTAKLYIKDGKTAATVTGGSNGIDSTSAMADPEFLKQIADSLKANSDGSV